MEPINYKRRICEDTAKIESFLERSRVGILGLNAGEYPYAVPVNYIWLNGKIYFHGMGSGKRETLLQKEPRVSFTVYEEYGTAKDKVPWHADTAYFSVMAFGWARKVDNPNELAAALRSFTEKFMSDFYKERLDLVSADFVKTYRSSLDGNLVAAYSIKPDWLSAKENTAAADDLFKRGDTPNHF
jgi:nitroimidazol reductase NimA-like FMN-containing flavoprotein (pyridoxamine 5'-phosphate oxidase superfamily)